MSSKSNKRKQFTDKFKREAVALMTEQGFTLTQASESLGVREDYLRRWKKKYENDSTPQGLLPSEREELTKLRKEVKELKMEKEILKKASAFFAKEMN